MPTFWRPLTISTCRATPSLARSTGSCVLSAVVRVVPTFSANFSRRLLAPTFTHHIVPFRRLIEGEEPVRVNRWRRFVGQVELLSGELWVCWWDGAERRTHKLKRSGAALHEKKEADASARSPSAGRVATPDRGDGRVLCLSGDIEGDFGAKQGASVKLRKPRPIGGESHHHCDCRIATIATRKAPATHSQQNLSLLK